MIKPEDIISKIPMLDNLSLDERLLLCSAMELYHLKKLEEFLFNDLMDEEAK